jgi:hypothetical protein
MAAAMDESEEDEEENESTLDGMGADIECRLELASLLLLLPCEN